MDSSPRSVGPTAGLGKGMGWVLVGSVLLIGLVGLATLDPAGPIEGALPQPPAAPPASVDSVAVSWEPVQVPQGTLFEVRVSTVGAPPLDRAEGTFSGEPLHFQRTSGEELMALAAAPVDALGERELTVDLRGAAGSGERRVYAITVVPGDYEMERLSVAPEFGDPLPAELQRRVNVEYERAMAVSRASHDRARMWEGPFSSPRATRVTSGFGGGRVFNGQVQSRHLGTDFQGSLGEPVLAPGRGVVALVGSFYLGGNVIYIDHGAGLVTGYLHLSAQEVREGEVVEPSQVIGRVGATGRVTGPHLHWIVRYGVITVDGTSLLELP